MATEFEKNSKSSNQGLRAIFMLLFWLASRVVVGFIFFLGAFQLICMLLSKGPNDKVMRFGKSLGLYVVQIVDFLTYNSDRKPWPFHDWPTADEVTDKET